MMSSKLLKKNLQFISRLPWKARPALEESMMVLRQCAMVIIAEPLKFAHMALWMNASVSPSTLAVASSSTSTFCLDNAVYVL